MEITPATYEVGDEVFMLRRQDSGKVGFISYEGEYPIYEVICSSGSVYRCEEGDLKL